MRHFWWLAVVPLVACGGGSTSPTQPTAQVTPAPTPTPFPQLTGNPCDATIFGFRLPIQGIFNGTDCSAQRALSSVVLVHASSTVISDQWILTCAHGGLSETTELRVDLGFGPMTSSEIHIMPGFIPNSSSPNDVALVKFPRSLRRKPVPLLLSRDAIPGEPAVMAGFGDVTAGEGAGVLRAAFGTVSSLTSAYVVANSPPSMCSGDSGGPILVKQGNEFVIAGVLSHASLPFCTTPPGWAQYVRLKRDDVSAFILQYVPDAIRR